MFSKTKMIPLVFACSMAGAATAQDAARHVIYLGAGTSHQNGSLTTDDTPVSLGYLNMSSSSARVFGVDVAGEGAMFDGTGGRDRVRQAVSINGLFGTNLYSGNGVRADAMLLLGARETVSDCPESFLGYICYADQAPETEYDLNYGAMLSATFNRVFVGLRATGESAQITAGLQF